ncbi:hypothetical protein XENOCAPTIV_000615 [Xenoophorus captivus]|uniref:Pentraxin (PTX) domain-containing protein n=1 Tax=Xenoophorus captivus TaxID=1517983 RepID=A0ABV0Q777_9TELE
MKSEDSSMILILDFSRSSDRTYARLLHKFPSMSSVTICTQLRFNPNSFGISTIFSYSVNDFQLRANLAQGRPVQLALLIHGKQGSYAEAFEHDDSWHSVCVSWSQDGGRWALYAHGHLVSIGNGVNSNDDIIGPNGSFILGERQNGDSFLSNDSFRGSITELHIWDRVLSSCEILTMENECSTISSGLVLRWSEASLEIEVSLRRLQGKSPCQEKYTLPKSPFVSRLSEDPKIRQVMEELSVNSSRDIDLTSLQQLTQAALYAIEADGPRPLTSSDILYLSQVIDSTAASARSAGANTTEVMVNIGPFTIIKSIDGLTEALADTLSAEQRDFTLSTKNIGDIMFFIS